MRQKPGLSLPPFLCAGTRISSDNSAVNQLKYLYALLARRISELTLSQPAMANCLISVGANTGNRAQTLATVRRSMSRWNEISSLVMSSPIETQPAGGPAGQPPFLNAAIQLETNLSPEQLLKKLLGLEMDLGRTRHQIWDPRSLDLDLLLYDGLVCDSEDLILPHPRMTLRRFVLEPICELAPAIRHPQTGWSMQEHLDHLQTSGFYIQIAGPPCPARQHALARLAACDDTVVISRPAAEQTAPAEMLQLWQDTLLKATRAGDAMVITDFCMREVLLQNAEQLGLIQKLEQVMLPPRLLVLILEKTANNDVRDFVNRLMPDKIVSPWLALPADNPDRIVRELQAAMIAAI